MNPFIVTLLLAQAEPEGTTWWQTLQAGGVIGYIIMSMSVVALGVVIVHLVQIRRKALFPPNQLEDLDQLLARGNVNGALEYCMAPEADSCLTRIMAAGLNRYQKSAFGAFEIKNAIEEAHEEEIARLYRSTDVLGAIGAIAPLLGLLGTVQGMIGAFEAISRAVAPNHEELAGNISLALVTTLQGLCVAIPCIALHRYFSNRIDALASKASQEVERLVLNLESAGPAGAPARPRAATTPGPATAAAPVPKAAAGAGGRSGGGAGAAAGGGGGGAGGAAP